MVGISPWSVGRVYYSISGNICSAGSRQHQRWDCRSFHHLRTTGNLSILICYLENMFMFYHSLYGSTRCCKSQYPNWWEWPNFDPPPVAPKPVNALRWNLECITTSQVRSHTQIDVASRQQVVSANTWLVTCFGFLINLFMVALCNRADHYIFARWFLSSSFFFPRLISAVGDWMSTILPHTMWFQTCILNSHSDHTMCGLSANLECRSEICCVRLAENTGRKKVAKNRYLGTITHLCRAISSQLRHVVAWCMRVWSENRLCLG